MLAVKNITQKYSDALIPVKNVSLKLEDNRCYVLIGESGSGKSTLAKIFSAMLKPTNGEVLLDGKNLWQMNKEEQRLSRMHFQLVFQNSKGALNPRKTIYETIIEPLRNFKKLSNEEEKNIVLDTIEKIGLDDSLLNRKPCQLSGGQLNRVCIARAICLKPRYIIFDESVSGLDVTVQKKVLDLLKQLRKELKTTYLFITHDIDIAMYMADCILVMKDGEIAERVENPQSYDDFNHSYSTSLIQALLPKTPYDRKGETHEIKC